jgi:hypothetical protein
MGGANIAVLRGTAESAPIGELGPLGNAQMCILGCGRTPSHFDL